MSLRSTGCDPKGDGTKRSRAAAPPPRSHQPLVSDTLGREGAAVPAGPVLQAHVVLLDWHRLCFLQAPGAQMVWDRLAASVFRWIWHVLRDAALPLGRRQQRGRDATIFLGQEAWLGSLRWESCQGHRMGFCCQEAEAHLQGERGKDLLPGAGGQGSRECAVGGLGQRR